MIHGQDIRVLVPTALHVTRDRVPRAAICGVLLLTLLGWASAAISETGSAGSAPEVDAQAGASDLEDEVDAQARLQDELREAEAAQRGSARAAKEAQVRAGEAEEEAQRARSQQSYGTQIADELSKQGQLLYQAHGRGHEPESLLMPTHDAGAEGFDDPRRAPIAPIDRDLPDEIFDEQRVNVPAQTHGSHPEIDALERTLDADGDGKPELVRIVDPTTGQLIHQASDRDYNGRLDTWNDYEKGVLVRRKLDTTGDGRPDTWEEYENGRAVSRERDRDGSGKPDVFYVYEGAWLSEERHDSNADGRVDLVVFYAEGVRTHSEEDLDRDGRMDTWSTWLVDVETGRERVSRTERDRSGDGVADTFEIYSDLGGRAVLERLEEDRNGDGRVDVISFFEGGKLRRRQISDPDA